MSLSLLWEMLHHAWTAQDIMVTELVLMMGASVIVIYYWLKEVRDEYRRMHESTKAED